MIFLLVMSVIIDIFIFFFIPLIIVRLIGIYYLRTE